MPSKRVLITGVNTYWGGRLAQALERDPAIEAVIGVAAEDPSCELERAEYVRVGIQHALLRRIVQAAEIDTVIDTRLMVDSVVAPPKVVHENNVIGTMNVLAACSPPDSPVKKVVIKSSSHYYGAHGDDPAFFTERMQRPHPAGARIERDIVDAERAIAAFAERNRKLTVTVLRFANGLGPNIRTSTQNLLSGPFVPGILGFDPRYGFIHEDDIVGVLEYAAQEELDGIYNAVGDGVLVLSEVASLLGKPYLPILPPWGTGNVAGQLRRLGLRFPPEVLNQMRYGRGLDNRKLKAAGYHYRYTSREAVLKLAEHLRVAHLQRAVKEPYRYEREVEEFLRWSPSVRRRPSGQHAPQLSPSQATELRKLLDHLVARQD